MIPIKLFQLEILIWTTLQCVTGSTFGDSLGMGQIEQFWLVPIAKRGNDSYYLVLQPSLCL